MIHHRSPVFRRHDYCFMMASLLLALLTTTLQTALVQAQTSCSAPQSITAPFSFTPSSVEPVDNSYYFSTLSICDDALASGSSAFPAGFWFRYIASKPTMVRVSVEVMEGFMFSVATVAVTGSCESLKCEDSSATFNDLVFQAEVGVEYFIFVFSDADGSDPYTLFVEELEPPANDSMETAVALTQDDLPFRGDFTTVGALSDFSQDVCGLFGENGVWFKYTTTYAQESLALRATTGNTREVLGIQSRSGDRDVCVTSGSTWGSTIEWTAETGIEYYILVSEPANSDGQLFEFTLQSQGIVEGEPEPAPVANPVTPAPVANPVTPSPPTATDAAPVETTGSPSGVGSNSSDNNQEPTTPASSGSGRFFNAVALYSHVAGLVLGVVLLEAFAQ
ncbi:hypothetical protein FisN_42Hh003 [Fistulifera solaris]|uniref:Uncharacterized protein n=1 Tax=Fistulifera solaris TaxID=1519565 RepID=A0A1Z5KIH6_FISSO|nr:hypothetical protein FisN_42Hh003 [Fistulifera solaris]|eukprot:GAX26103.1 hypothetical protein FisN_42Hh003 [Fistulifera solaris]